MLLIITRLLVPMEMIFVNLAIIDFCCTRKYSKGKTYGLLAVFSIAVACLSYWLLSSTFSEFGNGNGLFVLIGFIFLIPLKLLYRNTTVRLITVVCSAWIYTLTTFSLSVHLARLVPAQFLAPCALFVQTLLYAATIHWYLSLVKNKIVFIIQNASGSIQNLLKNTAISWYMTTLIVHISLLYTQTKLLPILAMGIIYLNVLLNYGSIYKLVKSFKDIKKLERIAYIDHLTGLNNRTIFFNDVDELILNGVPFSLILSGLRPFQIHQ